MVEVASGVVVGIAVVLLLPGGATVLGTAVLDAPMYISFGSNKFNEGTPVVILGDLIGSVVKRDGNSVVKNDGKNVGVVASDLNGGEIVTVGVFVRRGTTVLLGGGIVRCVVEVVVVVASVLEMVVGVSAFTAGTVIATGVVVIGALVDSGALIDTGEAIVPGAFVIGGAFVVVACALVSISVLESGTALTSILVTDG